VNLICKPWFIIVHEYSAGWLTFSVTDLYLVQVLAGALEVFGGFP
jgi:hypothetical protein